jgi:hypothetical protein
MVEFAFQIGHENIKKTLDGAYLANFGIDIRLASTLKKTHYWHFNSSWS